MAALFTLISHSSRGGSRKKLEWFPTLSITDNGGGMQAHAVAYSFLADYK